MFPGLLPSFRRLSSGPKGQVFERMRKFAVAQYKTAHRQSTNTLANARPDHTIGNDGQNRFVSVCPLRATTRHQFRYSITSREQLYASINLMEESIAARGAPPGNTSSEGAGDGAWLRPRRTFQPHA